MICSYSHACSFTFYAFSLPQLLFAFGVTDIVYIEHTKKHKKEKKHFMEGSFSIFIKLNGVLVNCSLFSRHFTSYRLH